MGLILALATACGEAAVAPGAPAEGDAADMAELSAVELLTRASLDLRGVRPSVEEIEAVEADPGAVDATIEGFLGDARFGERVRSLFADVYLTRRDTWYVTAADYGLGDQPAYAASVGDEPLRILSTIAEEDLPYTQIVTADWTMADEHLGAAWPLDYPEGGTGWRKARYTDGRPSAGVLSTNGLWWRYMSNASNANRGRANAISRIFLCSDYLTKPIEFDRDVNLLDADAVNDALRSNPGCVACHYALDPLASYLWGFFYFNYASREETSAYHPEREQLWKTYTGVSPAYHGEPGWSLEDLGRQIAGDARLPQCVTEQVYELLLQREASLDDTTRLTELREVLLAERLTLRPLFLAVTRSPEYRAAPDGDASGAGRKMVSADQLASQVEDLTGFRFVHAGYDMLGTDTYGLRTLAGGVDGEFSTSPAETPTATAVLVQERLAQAAAAYVAAQDRADPDGARLFREVGFTTTPASDPDAFARQIQHLHLRLYGTRVDAGGPEVAANLALWEELYAVGGDGERAWAGLLAVLLRDPLFLFY